MKRALVFSANALNQISVGRTVQKQTRFPTKTITRPFLSASSWSICNDVKHRRRRKRGEKLIFRHFSALDPIENGTEDIAQVEMHGGFEDIWVRAKTRALSLQERPVGSLESHQWLEIVELLKLLPSLDTAKGDRVVDAFLLLNRLKIELESIKSLSKNGGEKELADMTFLPLEDAVLFPVINAWRDSCIMSVSSRTSWSLSQLSTKPMTLLRVISSLKNEGLFQETVEASNRLLASLKKFPDTAEAARQADGILEFLLTNSKGEELPRDSASHPNEETLRLIVALWSRSGDPHAYRKAERHYNLLAQWWEESRIESFRMSASFLCSVMEAYSKSAPPEVAFPRIMELQMEMTFSSNVDLMSWNRVCHALAHCRHPKAADAVLEILQRLKNSAISYESLSSGTSAKVIGPDNSIYLEAIKALGRAGRANEAQKVFDELDSLAEEMEMENPSLRPTTAHYSALIWAYARKGDTVGARSMFARLRRISERDKNVRLDHQAIHGVLVAWAESEDPYGPEEAINFLNEMIDEEFAIVDTRILNILMKNFSNQNSPEGAERAEECYEMMKERDIHPDRDTFLNLVSAWANAGEPERSENILHYCFREAKAGSLDKRIIDLQHFDVVLNAWENSGKSESAQRALEVFQAIKDYGLQPNTRCYSSMFGVLWRCQSPGVLQIAHQSAEGLCRRLDDDDLVDLKLDTICLNKALLAMSKATAQSDLLKVHDFYKRFLKHGVKPDNTTYSIMMGVSSKLNRPRETDAFFQAMLKSGDTSLSPDIKTYSTRVTAWSRNGNPGKTLDVLNEWKKASETGLIQKPSQRDADAILFAWEKSGAPDAAIQAEQELDRRILSSTSTKNHGFDESPTVQSFNIVISTYAKSKSPDAGKHALAVFQKLLSFSAKAKGGRGLEPNFLSYSGVILALTRSSEPLALEGVKMLLQDLQRKSPSFWEKLENAAKLESNLKYAVNKSHFPLTDRKEMTKTIANFMRRADRKSRRK